MLASCISRLVWLVWLGSGCKNEEELVWHLSVGFMYFAARLARQWMEIRGITCMAFLNAIIVMRASLRFIYLAEKS